jgi:hypothetical protein
MSGYIEIDDMPDLGAVTDTTEFVGEKAGSGVFTATAMRDYMGASSLPLTGGVVDGTLGITGMLHVAASPTSITADGDVDIGGHLTVAGNVILTGGTLTFTGVTHVASLVLDTLPPTAANDAAAAGLGVPVGGIYCTGSALMVRRV